MGTENDAAVQIHYEDHGSGQPVVLIHGYPLDGNSWERQERVLLPAAYRVISYDRRGFGRSSQPTIGYDYDTYAADLNALLGHLDLQDIMLVGFSQGVDGQVFEDIKAAIAADRYAYFKDFFDNFYNVDVFGPSRISAQAWQASFNVAAGASPYASYACVDSWPTDFRGDLPKIDVPVLVVHGTEDQILPFAATAQRLPGLVDDLRLVTVEGGPHNIAWTHPEEVNSALLEFLAAR